jgi:hypothetical protein
VSAREYSEVLWQGRWCLLLQSVIVICVARKVTALAVGVGLLELGEPKCVREHGSVGWFVIVPYDGFSHGSYDIVVWEAACRVTSYARQHNNLRFPANTPRRSSFTSRKSVLIDTTH